MQFTIIGSGLAGLSASFHLGYEFCNIYEKNNYYGGHIFSELKNNFTWDEGPHVSFTKYEYVKELFAQSVDNDFLEHEVETVNYYHGHWIPHPAQSNLYALPEPLRSECLNDFLLSRKNTESALPKNYDDWLRIALGNRFTDEFSTKYTKKYWTTHPKNLTTNWIGGRIFYPNVEDIINGFKNPLPRQTHYIQKIRYPRNGGYLSFAKILYNQSNVELNKEVIKIDLKERMIFFKDGSSTNYEKLINTLPLPLFVEYSNISDSGKDAASNLRCSSLLLVNVIANHPTVRSENWIYVYDEDKYSTRIHCTELLSPNNGVYGKTGIQVEVYFSDYRKKNENDKAIANQVIKELIEMGLIQDTSLIDSFFTRWVPWGNVIFDHDYKNALDTVLSELEEFGLIREDDDLEPITNWDKKQDNKETLGSIIMAGRYGQWKYYWTDDCVLRGKFIGEYFSG
jgi:protoporphyrinogen oxidase